MSCGIGPGVAEWYGGTWGTESGAKPIWDFTDKVEVGRVSAATSGELYAAVVVPIPILASTRHACDSLGDQLLEYLCASLSHENSLRSIILDINADNALLRAVSAAPLPSQSEENRLIACDIKNTS